MKPSKGINVSIYSVLIYFLIVTYLAPFSYAQTEQSASIRSSGSIIALESPPTQPPQAPSGKVTTVGNKIIDAEGRELILVGGNIADFGINMGSALSYATVNREKIKLVSDLGCNFISIGANSEFWVTEPRRLEYRARIADIVRWCREFDLYYRVQIHYTGASASSIGNLFSGPGNNWKMAATEPYRSNAIQFFEDIIALYGDDPLFVGVTPLNEPWRGRDFTKWDVCVEFYHDVIDAVVNHPSGKGVGTILWVAEPYAYGDTNEHWESRGYIEYPHVIYEFHNYHWNHRWGDEPRAWAYEYTKTNPNREAAKDDLRTYHQRYVLMNNQFPVYVGEFSSGYGLTDAENLEYCSSSDLFKYKNCGDTFVDQMAVMYEMGISYSVHSIGSKTVSNRHTMFNNDGETLNSRGQLWATAIPSNLLRP